MRDGQKLSRRQQGRDAQLVKIGQRMNKRQQKLDEQPVKVEQSSPRFTRQPNSPTYCSTETTKEEGWTRP